MKIRFILSGGFILLLLITAGCGGDSLKASYFQSRPETGSLDGSAEESLDNPETNCSALNPHPLAESMAGQFEVSYEDIMTWYCDGYAFSDILLALETAQLVDQSAGELLSLLESRSWEEIWDALGVNPDSG